MIFITFAVVFKYETYKNAEGNLFLFKKKFFKTLFNQIKISMKRKDYQKPTMTVAKLKHSAQLLAGSGFGAMRNKYGEANQSVDQSELNDAGEWEWN